MKVIWSNRAVADLRAITDRISRDNPSAAARLAKRIFDEITALDSYAFRGRVGAETDTRELIFACTSYIAVYRVVGEEVHVLRIRHAAQRWPSR